MPKPGCELGRGLCLIFVIVLALFCVEQRALPQENPPPLPTIAEEQDYAFAHGLYKDGLFQLASEQFERFIQQYPRSIKLPDAFFLKAECLFQLEQFDAAVVGFSSFLQQYPSSNLADNAYFRLGDTNLKLKKTQEAISAYKTILEKYGESKLAGEAAYWIGEAHVKNEEYDSAIKYYTLSYENYPDNRLRDYALYSVAWTHQRKGDYARAAEWYRLLLKEFPQSTLAASSKVRIGECYYYVKDYARAIEELKSAKPTIDSPEQRGEADYLLGESYYHLDQYDQARKQYEIFLASYRDHKLGKEVTYALGWTLLKQKEYAAAAETFAKLSGGGDALAHSALYRKGVAEKLAGKRQEAMKTFIKVYADEAKGEYADNALYDVGLLLFEEKKPSEARGFFERVTGEYPASDVFADAYQMAGECLLAESNYEAARSAFEKALAHQQASFEVKVTSSYQIGWCLYKLNRFNDAAAQFSKFVSAYAKHPRSAEATYWLAESEYRSGDFRAALKHYKAVAESPEHERKEEGMYGVGWSYYKLNDFPNAIDAFERLVIAYPAGKSSFDARLRLGDCYFHQKDYKKAAGVYRTVVRLFPKNDGADYAYYQLAQTYFRSADHQQASQQFSAVIKAFPQSPLADDAQYALGWIQFQKKEYLAAIKEFQLVIANYPESEIAPRAYYSIGDAYYNLQQYAAAEKSYREVIRRYPKSNYLFDAMTGIQYCLTAQGKPQEALAIIDSYVQENPGSAIAEQLSLRKGDLLFGQKQYDAAAREYRSFLDRYPQTSQRATALYWLARSLSEFGKPLEAADVYEQAAGAKNAPGKIVSSSLLEAAEIFRGQKKYDQAFAVLTKAEKELAKTESEPEVALLKGLVFYDNGAIDEAKGQFEFVISKFPSTIQADRARVGLVKVHMRMQDYGSAQALAQKVATSRIDEVGAEAQYLSGIAYAENKEWQNAATAFLRLRYVFPSHERWLAKSYLGLGQAYEELKNSQKAKEAYRNALKFQKEEEVVAEASRRLKSLE